MWIIRHRRHVERCLLSKYVFSTIWRRASSQRQRSKERATIYESLRRKIAPPTRCSPANGASIRWQSASKRHRVVPFRWARSKLPNALLSGYGAKQQRAVHKSTTRVPESSEPRCCPLETLQTFLRSMTPTNLNLPWSSRSFAKKITVYKKKSS